MKNSILFLVLLSLFNYALAENLKFKILAPIIPSADYDTQTNIFKPSEKELALEKVRNKISKASLLSFVPLLSTVPANLSDLSMLPKNNFLELANSSVTNLGSTLLKEIEKIKTHHPELVEQIDRPVVTEHLVMPWQSTGTENLFYQTQKVSVSRSQDIPYMLLTRDSNKFKRKLNDDLIAYHLEQSKNSKLPVYLLGVRSFSFIDFEHESHFTLRILIGLKGNPDLAPDFNNPAPEVILDKIVVPQGKKKDLVAALTFKWSLSKTPTLTVRFGELSGYDNGEFQISSKGAAKLTPRLEGTIVVPGILNQIKARMSKDKTKKPTKSWLKLLEWSKKVSNIAMNFSFQEIVMDLSTARLTSVKSLMSPGIRINKTNYVMGSFANSFIDQTFKEEINKGIEMQMKMVLDKILSYTGGKK